MDYFKTDKIPFEGPESKNPLAFKHYNPEELVEGKPMKEHLRFAAPYWHVMRNPLGDPFGAGTARMPWDDGSDSIDNALRRVDAFFEFLHKLGFEFYCWHDRDLAPECDDLAASHKALDAVIPKLKEKQTEAGVQLLWGTACLFNHPRYAHGAATSPDANVYAYAAGQVKKALECAHELDGLAYLFWGGREGYGTLLNTNMKRELDHLAAFLRMAVEHARKIGFTGAFYIEPKPREPTTHQYDSDAAACLNFLREYGLTDSFKLNIETNHATLAGHTVEHDLTVAADAGMLGSVDANRGDLLLGWDTDQFPTDIYQNTQAMLRILGMGGFTTGGLNFDAKRRRESHDPMDLVYAHIGGMDAFARALKIAAAIRRDGRLAEFIRQRYRSFDQGIGAKVEAGATSLEELEKFALENEEPVLESGRQEMLENLINEFI